MNAVSGNRCRTEYAEIPQPLHHPLAVATPAVIGIGQCFRRVDVTACSQFRRLFGAAPQQIVIQGKGCMQSEQGATHRIIRLLTITDVCGVFRNALRGHRFAVAVRHFVAQACAQAQFFCRIGNLEQAAFDAAGTGMVIKHRGHAVADAVHHGHRRAVIDVFGSQHLIQSPPQPFQNLTELLRRLRLQIHAAGKTAVKMHMSIDQTRHDEAASRIDKSRAGIFSSQHRRIADFYDPIRIDRHRACINH